MSSIIDTQLFQVIPNLYIINIISEYVFPNRTFLSIRDKEDCVNYLNYPKTILEYCENEVEIIIEYFVISGIFYYRIIFSENIVDNTFHYIKDCFDKEELMSKWDEIKDRSVRKAEMSYWCDLFENTI